MTTLLSSLCLFLGNLLLCIYASSPFLLIIIVPIVFACLKLLSYYLKTQRQCFSFENTTKSPIIEGFTSAIDGLSTIRAYNIENKYLETQMQKVSTNKRMRMIREALENWFAIRLAMLTFCINMTAICFSLFSHDASASLLGLLLAYAMNLNEDIVNTIESFAEL